MDRRTIEDFGDQFSSYRTGHNQGFYGSLEGLRDTMGPLLDTDGLKGLRVAEIGSGPGRLVNMLLDAGVEHVTALEPSTAIAVLKENTATRSDHIDYVNAPGHELPLGEFDAVFSVGVLHHIPDVDLVVRRAHSALKHNGRFYAWLYGYEGNELALAILNPLREITKRVPDFLVAGLSHLINTGLALYIILCRATRLPLPLSKHMLGAMAHYTRGQRFLVVFDQLNPAYAKYYTRAEAASLFERNGFVQVELHHRHGHSWAVRATKMD